MTVEQTQTAPATDPNVVVETQTAQTEQAAEPSFEDAWMAGETVVEKPAEPEVLEPDPVKQNDVLDAHRAAAAETDKEYAEAHAALGAE